MINLSGTWKCCQLSLFSNHSQNVLNLLCRQSSHNNMRLFHQKPRPHAIHHPPTVNQKTGERRIILMRSNHLTMHQRQFHTLPTHTTLHHSFQSMPSPLNPTLCTSYFDFIEHDIKTTGAWQFYSNQRNQSHRPLVHQVSLQTQ